MNTTIDAWCGSFETSRLNRVLRFFLIVFLGWTLSSCATEPKTPKAPPVPAEFAPRTFDPKRVEDLLLFQYNRIKSIQADTNIRFGPPGGKTNSANATIAYQSPRRFFMRGYNKFIPQLFVFIVKENTFWFYIPKEAVVFTGTKEKLDKPGGEFQLELNGFDILDSLISRPLKSGGHFEQSTEDHSIVVNDYTPDVATDMRWLTRKVWINSETLDVVRELHYTADNIQSFEIERSQYFDERGWRIPKFMSITRMREQKTTLIMYWNVKINTPIDPAVFDFKTPKDVRVVEI